jgi:hypothetical protein
MLFLNKSLFIHFQHYILFSVLRVARNLTLYIVSGPQSDEGIGNSTAIEKNKNKGLVLIKQDSMNRMLVPETSEQKTVPIKDRKEIHSARHDQERTRFVVSGELVKSHPDQYLAEINGRKEAPGNKLEPIAAKEDHAIHSNDEEGSSTTNDQQYNPEAKLAMGSMDKKSAGAGIDPSKKKTARSFSKNKDWFLEGYGSPDIPFNNDYPASANSYFQEKLSYTFGLRLGKSFGRHFSGRIGIQFSRINELPTGDSGILNMKIHYKSIDMPFLIGYDLKNPNLNLTINAGLVLNIYTWVNSGSDYLNSIHFFRPYSGISLYLGLNYVRPINERLLIMAEPYFRYRLSNMVNSQAGFTQKTNVAGLSMGVRYQFDIGKQRK